MEIKKYINLLLIYILFLFSIAYSQLEQLSVKNQSTSEFDTISTLDSSEIDSIIKATMNQCFIPGLSACIVRDGKILWNNSYGYSDIALNKMVNDSTSFLLASISKTIICTALMQLWEDGLFQLDDDINDYLPPDLQVRNPYFPDDKITFRHLLTHTSSIDRDDDLLLALISWGYDSPISINSFLMDYFMPGGQYYDWGAYLNRKPGTHWQYSNFSVALAGYLVEVISGTPLDVYCNVNIFDPLKMFNTGWFLSDLDSNNIATPYDSNGNAYTSYGYYGNPAYPCGWLKASAKDLARFLIMFINNGKYRNIRILDSTTVELINTVQYPSFAPWQGLIWYTSSKNGKLYRGHNGGLLGCMTEMDYLVDDEDGLGVIVLTTGDTLESYYGMMEVWTQLFKFGKLYKKIYPLYVNISSHYINPGLDTLTITTKMNNPENHALSASAIITGFDSAYIDSISLFDDGNHGDSLAGDGMYGGYLLPISFEDNFNIDIKLHDLDSTEVLNFNDVSRFTTCGPVIVNNTILISESVRPGSRIQFKLELRNLGSVATAMNISATIACIDTSLASIYRTGNATYGSILPGDSSITSGEYYVDISQNCPDNTDIFFKLNIAANNYMFWTDTFSVFVNGPDRIIQADNIVPRAFALKQNYPNPFNPSTSITYELPKPSQVELSIYNILGEKVTTLVSGKQPAGSYRVQWDASGLASGIYLYRIETGTFQETKKLILLK